MGGGVRNFSKAQPSSSTSPVFCGFHFQQCLKTCFAFVNSIPIKYPTKYAIELYSIELLTATLHQAYSARIFCLEEIREVLSLRCSRSMSGACSQVMMKPNLRTALVKGDTK